MLMSIGIPYYVNSLQCEVQFKKLMKTLRYQLTNNTPLIIYEDGQISEWLSDYAKGCISLISNPINKGAAYARNILLDHMRHYDYILFLDSDDMVDCDFISKMYEAANTGEFDMIVSIFNYAGKVVSYPQRSNVAGICLRTDFIKGIEFNEDYIISEDTKFIEEVYKRKPRIGTIDSTYYYNYGSNPNSLMMRYERSEIGIKRC